MALLTPTRLNAQQIRGNFKGTVQDEFGKTISGATLVLQPDGHTVQTDEKGVFSFKNIIAGNYQLRVSLIGKAGFNATVRIYPSETTEIEIKLTGKEHNLDEVKVSSKQTDPDNLIDIERSAMPVTVISRRQIEMMGSRRLDEVLKEQTGIAIVNNIGGGSRSVGLQMQGFGSEYVMILIDGQPMMGRNSGNFDLSRISVNNIEKIEIIKGASSCLFGSEALGGAINIVTRHGAVQPQGMASLRYGSLNILDAVLEGETPFASQRGSVNLSANYYRTDGFNTDPTYLSGGTTAPPYNDFSLQGRARYRSSESATLGVSGRYSVRKSYMEQIYSGGKATNTSGDTQNITDLNLSATFDQNFDNGLRSMSRYYLTSYRSKMNVVWQQSGAEASSEAFNQILHRFEQQFAYAAGNTLKFTGGLGASLEKMDNRDFSVPGGLWSSFGYLQSDWQALKQLEITGGLRYDHHNRFGGKLNPSLGLQYHVTSELTLKMALGSGFKTPDYRQRYQVFMNPVANYLVVGTELLRETLNQMKDAGQISEIREYLVNQLDRNLEAERSLSFNGGFTYTPAKKIKLDINGFYHNISNQINSIRVATGTEVRDIYTYQNLPESFNTGLESTITFNPGTQFEISAGYQYLVSKDKGVMDSIRLGKGAYSRVLDFKTGMDRPSKLSDYFGIENRSRHMANIRMSYRYPLWDLTASVRLNYRGKYVFDDLNNNRFADPYDTFVSGYFLLNAALEKKMMNQHISIQLTADNVMDYTDRLMPGQSGRLLLLGLSYRFYKD
ncbi:TonB-dependent receptor [Pedobacter metabolipauper]|nr:TonB-dependent receptor [Pedobacter metabolipauper]